MLIPRIKSLREDKDIKQSAIAAQLGIGQRTYSHYETGARYIPTELLIAIAQFHNVSVDYLLDLTDDPTPPKRK